MSLRKPSHRILTLGVTGNATYGSDYLKKFRGSLLHVLDTLRQLAQNNPQACVVVAEVVRSSGLIRPGSLSFGLRCLVYVGDISKWSPSTRFTPDLTLEYG